MLKVLAEVVLANSGTNADWVSTSLDALKSGAKERDLHIFFGLAPRKLGKDDLHITPEQAAAVDATFPGWRFDDWSIDGAARVLALATFKRERPFADLFKDLRRTADVAELSALYRGLPLYPDPESLDFEVGEAMRSNLRPVFEAVTHNNPFPNAHFDEHRWNHMILKALFVDSELAPILGLEERVNKDLVRMLLDYAEERWAADRSVSPELWPLVIPFRDDEEFKDRLDAAVSAGRITKKELS